MELKLTNLVRYCRRRMLRIQVDEQGALWHGCQGAMLSPLDLQELERCAAVDALAESEEPPSPARARVRAGLPPWPLPPAPAPAPGSPLSLTAPGYEELAYVLLRAFNQAARGKGKERHANGEPFTRQVIMDGARRFGIGSLLFQAFKKSEESQRLPGDRGVAELLGAIVYLAAAVIAREAENPKADNDNNPQGRSSASHA